MAPTTALDPLVFGVVEVDCGMFCFDPQSYSLGVRGSGFSIRLRSWICQDSIEQPTHVLMFPKP